MNPRETPPPRSPAHERVEGWIRTMSGDVMLQPLLAVIVGHAIAFLVPVCLLAVRDRNPFAALALLILLFGSGSTLYGDWRHLGRPGPIGWTLLIGWSITGAAAALTSHFLLY